MRRVRVCIPMRASRCTGTTENPAPVDCCLRRKTRAVPTARDGDATRDYSNTAATTQTPRSRQLRAQSTVLQVSYRRAIHGPDVRLGIPRGAIASSLTAALDQVADVAIAVRLPAQDVTSYRRHARFASRRVDNQLGLAVLLVAALTCKGFARVADCQCPKRSHDNDPRLGGRNSVLVASR